MAQYSIDEGLQLIMRTGLAKPDQIRGCAEMDIDRLEQTLRLKLPAAYREFLRAVGRGAGSLLRGSDFLLDGLVDSNEAAQELVADEGLKPLQEGAFAFLMHQGYQFLFFFTGAGDDPAVYRFLEGEGVSQVARSFSEWWSRAVEDEVADVRR